MVVPSRRKVPCPRERVWIEHIIIDNGGSYSSAPQKVEPNNPDDNDITTKTLAKETRYINTYQQRMPTALDGEKEAR
jgi:hypothetical protein